MNTSNDQTTSLIAIDSLKVDDRVRITLTREVRRIFDIEPGDTIAIYQDNDTNEILLKIQRRGLIVNTLVVNQDNNISNYSVKVGKPVVRSTSPSQRISRNKANIQNMQTYSHRINDNPSNRYFPNIVVIDDDPAALLTFQSYLQSEGFGVQTFSDSIDAVDYLESHHSDYKIVISDIRMPETNGLKLYQRLKAIDKDIKIMFVTALDIIDEVLSMVPDFDEKYIMRKPIKRDQFVKRVKSVILEP